MLISKILQSASCRLMEKLLKDFSEDIKSATRGSKRKMRKVIARMKKGQDKFLKRTKLRKAYPYRIEGSSTSANEIDELQYDAQSSSTVYHSIDSEEEEEEEDRLHLNPSELHQTDQNDDLDPQTTSTTESDEPHSDADPPSFLPEKDEKTSFLEIIVEDKNNDDIIEDLEANLKKSDYSNQKLSAEQIFVILNFILEVPTAVFDQLSSKQKVQYALLSMLMSLSTMIICISELVYKGRRERVAWKWKREKKIMPWLYHPAPSNRPFGSVIDIVGVSCSIFQCIFTTTAYACYRRHTNNPIKISMWPIIFSLGLLCSKLLESQKRMFNS